LFTAASKLVGLLVRKGYTKCYTLCFLPKGVVVTSNFGSGDEAFYLEVFPTGKMPLLLSEGMSRILAIS